MKLRPRSDNGLRPSFKIKKNLNFTRLIDGISEQFRTVPDQRRQASCLYKQHDVMMAALSCMFFQEPSWLQYQKDLQEGLHDNNLRHLFDIGKIPQESQVRNILDTIDSEHYRPVFNRLFEQLRRDKQLEPFRIKGLNAYLVSIDGSQYFSSKRVHCKCCLKKEHRNGTTTWQHQVLQGAIMHPGCKQVIPLMPEAIRNEDGAKKQDCEHNAAKRFLTRLRQDHPRLPLIIGGDALFSDGPMTEQVRSLNMHYVFGCKPGDHPYLFEWLNDFDDWPWHQHRDDKKRLHRYRWRNQVPLSGQKDAPLVNYFEYQLENDKGQVTYQHSWVSDITINLGNIHQMVQVGRCRWKIENECFNTLKNQGYHMTHNFGHGNEHLSHNMYLSTLLAFLLHQILELCDEAYQQCRQRHSKTALWTRIRERLLMVIVEDWYWLMMWILDPKQEQVMLVATETEQ